MGCTGSRADASVSDASVSDASRLESCELIARFFVHCADTADWRMRNGKWVARLEYTIGSEEYLEAWQMPEDLCAALDKANTGMRYAFLIYEDGRRGRIVRGKHIVRHHVKSDETGRYIVASCTRAD